MDRRKINLAFIRLEHFLEQCAKLKRPNPPSLPTPEMAKNIRDELVFLLDNVQEITCDDVPSVLKVLTNARKNDIPGIHTYSEKALNEFLIARSNFIRRADINNFNGFETSIPVKPNHFKPNKVSKVTEWRQKEERDRMETKLNNNPNIADLSDMNRPTKVAEKFNSLYDNQWTDAFEDLRRLYKHEINGQERAILEMSIILKRAFEYTQETAEKQTRKIAMSMKELMISPNGDSFMNSELDSQHKHVDIDPLCEVRFPRYAKQCIKENAELSLPVLHKNFEWQLRRERIRDILTIPSVKSYSQKCLQIAWFMNVQDPPMSLLWPADVRRGDITTSFRFFTRSGTILHHEVWPALLLTSDGPMMIKGVAQFK
ncbi:uncharacterized protein LOC127714893 [Mytilus californianus]|uniref:uncharacterized protein LOC127714893 n=1 Tax=Mytilus californianus TaxID=6549 RepID=UPI002247E146|nr:uncharacterized protein LOC127714893 [Mytilus californianus]